jgi:hypothetical protein
MKGIFKNKPLLGWIFLYLFYLPLLSINLALLINIAYIDTELSSINMYLVHSPGWFGDAFFLFCMILATLFLTFINYDRHHNLFQSRKIAIIATFAITGLFVGIFIKSLFIIEKLLNNVPYSYYPLLCFGYSLITFLQIFKKELKQKISKYKKRAYSKQVDPQKDKEYQ